MDFFVVECVDSKCSVLKRAEDFHEMLGFCSAHADAEAKVDEASEAAETSFLERSSYQGLDEFIVLIAKLEGRDPD